MIVLDASAALELLLATEVGRKVAGRLHGPEAISAPQLLIIEWLQVLRRAEHRRVIDPTTAGELVADLLALDIELYDHRLVAHRVWELRDNLSAYDATYVALSELLGAALVTTDAKLADAPGNHALIELIRTEH